MIGLLALDGLMVNGAVWGLVLVIATFIGSIAVVAFLLLQPPTTYFLDSHLQGWWVDRHPILRAVRTLGDILRRMQAHQSEKRSMLRPLELARHFPAD